MIEKLTEVQNELFEKEDDLSQACEYIEKTQAILSAIGKILFQEDDLDFVNLSLNYTTCKQLFAVAKDNINTALDKIN